MNRCTCVPATWKGRHGYCIRNGHVEAIVLMGGGAIVDFRLCGSEINLLWESPWPTIDPHTFDNARDSTLYSPAPVGPMLSSCTGHVVVAGYYGMPPSDKPDLPLHGEACCSLWTVDSTSVSTEMAELTVNVEMPGMGLCLERRIQLQADSSALSIRERLCNTTGKPIDYQWVQHAMFGAPFFTGPHATLSLPASRCITWPHGYEGHPALQDNSEFIWPLAAGVDGKQLDLSQSFVRPHSGFIASVLLCTGTEAFTAIANTQLGLLVGYSFDHSAYPWVALWEENCARTESPWCGEAQVRGVEFGTSPMPIGLEQSRQQAALFGTPTYRTLGPRGEAAAEYSLFASTIRPIQSHVTHITRSIHALDIHFAAGETKRIPTLPR